MPKIFISYRRDDSAYVAHQICDALGERFGAENIIFDVESIPLGADFRTFLNEQVEQCDVLIALMGDQWLNTIRARRNDPADFVRFEIEAALKRKVPVVPVLVGKASIPEESDLPAGLAELAYRNATEVRAGADFRSQLDRLVTALEQLLNIKSTPISEPNVPPATPTKQPLEKTVAEKPASAIPSKRGKPITKYVIGGIALSLVVVIAFIILNWQPVEFIEPAVVDPKPAQTPAELLDKENAALLRQASTLSETEAIKVYQAVLKRDPNNVQAKSELEKIRTNNVEKAIKALKKLQLAEYKKYALLAKSIDSSHPDLKLLAKQAYQAKLEIQKREIAAREKRLEEQRKAEAERKREEERRKEEARQKELARKKELERRNEIARQKEEARQKEIARQKEEARQKEIARQKEEARQRELNRNMPAKIAAAGNYVQLTTMFVEKDKLCFESNKPVNVNNTSGGSHMARCGNYSGQLWKLVPKGNNYYQLKSMFTEKENRCLEGNEPGGRSSMGGVSFMAPCGNFTGQYWKFISQKNGYYKLQPQSMENKNKCLEGNKPGQNSSMDGKAFMTPCGNYSGQLWKFVMI